LDSLTDKLESMTIILFDTPLEARVLSKGRLELRARLSRLTLAEKLQRYDPALHGGEMYGRYTCWPRVWRKPMNPARARVPDRCDFIRINFNPQVGKEMRDRLPMLVLSPWPTTTGPRSSSADHVHNGL